MLYGFNGENWFDAQDNASRDWVIESIPEGESFVLRFRADKPDFKETDVDKLLQLEAAFSSANRELKVVYCINVKDNAAVQVQRLSYLINAGIDVIAVEYGNETYSKEQANFDFELYKSWFEPVKTLLEAEFPDMPQLIFLAPRPLESGVLGGRRDHSSFNEAAIQYINTDFNCLPTIHIYFNERECPVRNTEIAKRVYSESVVDTELNTYYQTLFEQADSNYEGLWYNTLNYLINRMPEKAIYITEWGFDNYGDIKNTFATAAIAWKIWNDISSKYKLDIAVLCQHNGLSKASPGMIFPAHAEFDYKDPASNNLRRADYWVFKMFRNMPADALTPETHVVTGPGTYIVRHDIINKGGVSYDSSVVPVWEAHTIMTNVYDIVEQNADGNFILSLRNDTYYTTCGATAWMAKGSERTSSLNLKPITYYPHQVSPAGKYFGYGVYTFDAVLPINEGPIADAGDDALAYTGEVITLDASGSYDPDGNIVGYKWYAGSGTLLGENMQLNIVHHSPGEHVYYLEVVDDKGAIGVDYINVTVVEKPCDKPWWCIFIPWARKCKC